MKKLKSKRGHEVCYVGTDEEKPLPAIFYFILSGHDSLTLDPFNQPVEVWKNFHLRVFSMTIPKHDEIFQGDVAIKKWFESFSKGIDPLTNFFHSVSEAIDDLVDEKIIDPNKIAVAGLSRGAFAAAHVAAINSKIKTLLGFAPLTSLTVIEEFNQLKNIEINKFDLHKLVDKLYTLTHRYYIGNLDIRVSTHLCYEYVSKLVNEMHMRGIRELPAELIINPSIGRMGHGTSQTTFTDGANWLARKLL